MSNADFRYGRFATDCGPACCEGAPLDHMGMWIYLLEPTYVLAQCACCHGVRQFDRPAVWQTWISDGNSDLTIHDIKNAHYNARDRKVLR